MRFCLLEQFLPEGSEHPFAQKMIRHFDNLQTPLQSIHQYPKLADQERRFLGARWSSVTARSLWDLWCDELFISSDRRLALDIVEPFDEWEEFVLFASHYFLLLAANTSSLTGSSPSFLGHPQCSIFPTPPAAVPVTLTCAAFPSSHKRRFGALAPLSQDSFGHHGGLGLQTRLSTTDVYMLSGTGPSDPANVPDIEEKCKRLESVEPRMCHSITSDHRSFLIAGGRASPDHVFKDCWLSSRDYWQRIEDLPMPLFRHCATDVVLEDSKSITSKAFLIYGGKTRAGDVSGQWLLWRRGFGWMAVPVMGDNLNPRFGAAIQDTGFRKGILLGGMANNGKILSEAYEWVISGDPLAFTISVSRINFAQPEIQPLIGRMGATLTKSIWGVLLVGGVAEKLIPQSVEVIRIFQENTNDCQKNVWNWAPVDTRTDMRTTGQRPLLVGHNTFASSHAIAVLGGGAVCFSFGTFWNETMLIVSHRDQEPKPFVQINAEEANRTSAQRSAAKTLKPLSSRGTSTVRRDNRIQSSLDFEHILNDGRPVIMGSMPVGLCTTDWTLPNLVAKIGGHRAVVVHEASGESILDFHSKNFKYVKKPFKDFVDEISRGSTQYLRSLSSENPAGQPADISVDFPELASSFKLPPQLDIINQKKHSSVLRISGPVTIWLHYDVMANVLCQIQGAKRLLLYPPSDVSLFFIPPGGSSSSINCFDIGPDRHPSLSLAHPQEVLLQPGEILYLPPLWLHTASPVGNTSISVNVFFRNLDAGYAPGRDTYGNRDLQAYEQGRREVDRIWKSFDQLPREMGRFYLERLADELKEKAERYSSS